MDITWKRLLGCILTRILYACLYLDVQYAHKYMLTDRSVITESARGIGEKTIVFYTFVYHH